jgi:hypothetical protein
LGGYFYIFFLLFPYSGSHTCFSIKLYPSHFVDGNWFEDGLSRAPLKTIVDSTRPHFTSSMESSKYKPLDSWSISTGKRCSTGSLHSRTRDLLSMCAWLCFSRPTTRYRSGCSN